jgi:hypothetical protein
MNDNLDSFRKKKCNICNQFFYRISEFYKFDICEKCKGLFNNFKTHYKKSYTNKKLFNNKLYNKLK